MSQLRNSRLVFNNKNPGASSILGFVDGKCGQDLRSKMHRNDSRLDDVEFQVKFEKIGFN